jgi:hypothetical protein
MMEELIHVSPKGQLHLDRKGKTMSSYKIRRSWLELIVKGVYDTVQALENVIAHADAMSIDVHRIVFFGSSAGSAEVNYLTWVYHQWNIDRFTPLGMILETPQLELPTMASLDQVWKLWVDHTIPGTKISQLMDVNFCRWFVGSSKCDQAYDAAAIQNPAQHLKSQDMCNSTWTTSADEQYCSEKFPSATLEEVYASQKWVASDPDVGSGLPKLWYTSSNMLAYQPQPFYLYVSSQADMFDHSPMYALAYAEVAAKVGIHYITYYSEFPGMLPSEQRPLGKPKAFSQGANRIFYHSSMPWRGAHQEVDRSVVDSLDEHLIFVCTAVGVQGCTPAGLLHVVHDLRRCITQL